MWFPPGVEPTLLDCTARQSRWICSWSRSTAIYETEALVQSVIRIQPDLDNGSVLYDCVPPSLSGGYSRQDEDVDPTFQPQDFPIISGWNLYGRNDCGTELPPTVVNLAADGGVAASACQQAQAQLAANAGSAVDLDACGGCFIAQCCDAFTASPSLADATDQLTCFGETGAPCSGVVVGPSDSTFVGCMNVYCAQACMQ